MNNNNNKRWIKFFHKSIELSSTLSTWFTFLPNISSISNPSSKFAYRSSSLSSNSISSIELSWSSLSSIILAPCWSSLLSSPPSSVTPTSSSSIPPSTPILVSLAPSSSPPTILTLSLSLISTSPPSLLSPPTLLTYEAWMVCYLKIWWNFVEVTWSHCFGIMPTLKELWRLDVVRVDQALYACPLYGSIIGKDYNSLCRPFSIY